MATLMEEDLPSSQHSNVAPFHHRLTPSSLQSASPSPPPNPPPPPPPHLSGDLPVLGAAKPRPGLAAYLPPSKEQAEEISVAFSIYQEDAEGRIGYHEAKSALRAMGLRVAKGELLAVLPQCAEDADGLGISREEFSRIAMRFLARRTPEEALRRDFAAFDSAGKGYVDLDDVRRVARQAGGEQDEADLRAIVAHFDSDGDGRLTLEDFAEALGRWRGA